MEALVLQTEWLLVAGFSAGIYVARNELQHKKLEGKVNQLLDHFGLKTGLKKK